MKPTSPDIDQAAIVALLKCLLKRGIISQVEAEQAAFVIAARNGAKYFVIL